MLTDFKVSAMSGDTLDGATRMSSPGVMNGDLAELHGMLELAFMMTWPDLLTGCWRLAIPDLQSLIDMPLPFDEFESLHTQFRDRGLICNNTALLVVLGSTKIQE